MRLARRLAAPAGALALAFSVLLLAGCVSEPTRLPPDTTKAQALQRLGQPTAVYALPGGVERLQYSRAPLGFEVSNVDIDPAGRVFSVRQEMDEGLFGSTIQPRVWREADILRTYGKPMEITRVASFDGGVWTWRFKQQNNRRFLYIYVDPQGLVDHYNVGDELFVEYAPR
ncbi:MAG: hypothetical protein ABWZ88_10995 [Variovorax sp.]